MRDARARRAAIVTYALISTLYAALWLIGAAVACVYVSVESVGLAVGLPAIAKGRLRQLDRAESEITSRVSR